ncbi:unnamed protein product [Calicophoron daubneyi]|uniref:V-SNARE coiled-coil homology domain-containing protein n=1 Tax=Calicophoron daubneyi TaxID=300641 RepID=A0AAV2TGV6_CALDB
MAIDSDTATKFVQFHHTSVANLSAKERSNDPSYTSQNLEMVRETIADVERILVSNCIDLQQNEAKLCELLERSEAMEAGARQFKMTNIVMKKMRKKRHCILICVVCATIILVGIVLVCSL